MQPQQTQKTQRKNCHRVGLTLNRTIVQRTPFAFFAFFAVEFFLLASR